MAQTGAYRVAFVISHPFQFDFFEAPARLLKDPIFVIETRADTPFTFSAEFIARLPGTVVTIDSNELSDLDGSVEVLVCMTPIPVLKLFEKTKVVCIQYSLSKEKYQYGPWRGRADLNLMFGPYSYERVSSFCAAEIVGNPRFDGRLPAERAPKEGSVLYLPTYGELSSMGMFERYLETREQLRPVTIRPHHASEFVDADILERLARHPMVRVATTYEDSLELILESAVVVSDFSGAAFDAAAAGAPVISLQPDTIPAQTVVRTTAKSLEIAAAERIGPVIRSASEIEGAIEAMLLGDPFAKSRAALVQETFANLGGAAPHIVAAIDRLMATGHERSDANDHIHTLYNTYLPRNRALQQTIASLRLAKRNADQRAKEATLRAAKLQRDVDRLTAAAKRSAAKTKAPALPKPDKQTDKAAKRALRAANAPRALPVPVKKKRKLLPW